MKIKLSSLFKEKTYPNVKWQLRAQTVIKYLIFNITAFES